MNQYSNVKALKEQYSLLGSIVSFLYRLTSTALFILLPVLLWVSDLSLKSVYKFSEARFWIFQPFSKILVILASGVFLLHSLVSIERTLINMGQENSVRTIRREDIVILTLTVIFMSLVGYWVW
jgi:succinate dehydrogenase/fumarate reductase cytochrome b subunit